MIVDGEVTKSQRLLSVGLFPTLPYKNDIWAKYLHLGKEDAAAPDLVIFVRLSRHFFRLSFRFFSCR